jgi:Transmembrane family 220, helix
MSNQIYKTGVSMKILNIVLVLLFVLFAAVQYNDPDPHVWIPIYLYPAAVSIYSLIGKYNKTFILIGLIPTALFMLSYIPDFINWIKMGEPSIVETMKAEKPYVELTREFGGLVICVAALVFQYFKAPNTEGGVKL